MLAKILSSLYRRWPHTRTRLPCAATEFTALLPFRLCVVERRAFLGRVVLVTRHAKSLPCNQGVREVDSLRGYILALRPFVPRLIEQVGTKGALQVVVLWFRILGSVLGERNLDELLVRQVRRDLPVDTGAGIVDDNLVAGLGVVINLESQLRDLRSGEGIP